MKPILILAALLSVCTASKILLLDPVQLVKEYFEVLEIVNGIEAEHKAKIVSHHSRPIVAAVWNDIYRNTVNLFTNFTYENFISMMIDMSSYFVMPLAGGLEACEAHRQYLKDAYVYNDAGVTEDYLFKQTANMFKEQYWEFFGMFSRVSKQAYEKVMDTYNDKISVLKNAQKQLPLDGEFVLPT